MDARILVDDVRFLARARDALHGAFPRADIASGAFVRIDRERDQILAFVRGASAVADMRLVFVAEVLDRGQYRVGRRLPQAASRNRKHIPA